jgi:dipeptidyl aminopeptidase/acylaminoacyl peptidase
VAVSLRSHNGRSPINLSPDGAWLAHTVEAIETIPRDSVTRRYSATGFPFAEGDSRMEATLTNTRTGEVIRLGGGQSASWAAVWSPDGQRVAFYSDEGGEAGLWIWEKASRQSRRVPNIIVRPFFGFEVVRWSSDGQRLLCKVLPVGTSIAQANAVGRAPGQAPKFRDVPAESASVYVQRAGMAPARPVRVDSSANVPATRDPDRDVEWAKADLAVVDVRSFGVMRLATNVAVRGYAFSPDGRSVAYSLLRGSEPNSQQPIYDLAISATAGGPSRIVARDIRMAYGIEWSWAPDNATIAYISSGSAASGEFVLVSAQNGTVRNLKRDSIPSFDPGDGENAPLWDAAATHLFGVANGKVWRMDAATGRGTPILSVPGWPVRAIVASYGSPTMWTTNRGRTMWAVLRERGGGRSAIWHVTVDGGESRELLAETKIYGGIFNLDASSATGEIALLASDQRHPGDIRLVNTTSGVARQGTHLNASLERYELGEATTIAWRSTNGDSLRGALLLPPGYQAGQRLPLVVYVYGGTMGSTQVNRFGFDGSLPLLNMHVLATRGFAVLYPDAPVRTGTTMTDIMASVMPGVDAAIALGYADSTRLGVMGQSYGSFNVLSIITQTTRFKAAVITAAVLHPDLAADYLRSVGYYEQGQGNMGGSLWQYRDRYIANSPLFAFDRIQTPVLMGQGERDGDLVPSDAIFVALKRLGKTVEYRLYRGEGHVITQRPNVMDFWKRRLSFFQEMLDVVYDDKGSVVFDDGRARSPRRQ